MTEQSSREDWVSPPVSQQTERTRYAARVGSTWEGADEEELALLKALKLHGPFDMHELSGFLRLPPRKTRKGLARLAALGFIDDVSQEASVRSQVWRDECLSMLAILGDGKPMEVSMAVALGIQAGVRKPRIACEYLFRKGIIEAKGQRIRLVVPKQADLPLQEPPQDAAEDQPHEAEALVRRTRKRRLGPTQSLMMEKISVLPSTARELLEHLECGRSRIYDLEVELLSLGLIRTFVFMGEKFFAPAAEEQEVSEGKLVGARRVADPEAVRAHILEAAKTGLPLGILDVQDELGLHGNTVRWVMDSMVADGDAHWDPDSRGHLHTADTKLQQRQVSLLPSVRYQVMLLTAHRLGVFTSVELNEMTDRAGLPTGPRPSFASDMNTRYGWLDAINPEESGPGRNVKRLYRLSAAGREIVEILPLLRWLDDYRERLDEALPEDSPCP